MNGKWRRLWEAAEERVRTTPRHLFVYALIDPRDGCVRYVGLTQDTTGRLASHKSRGRGSAAKRAWMEDLRAARLWPQLVVLAEIDLPIPDARDLELAWTEYFVAAGARLLNAEARFFPDPRVEEGARP